jgi:hypothetical protein
MNSDLRKKEKHTSSVYVLVGREEDFNPCLQFIAVEEVCLEAELFATFVGVTLKSGGFGSGR